MIRRIGRSTGAEHIPRVGIMILGRERPGFDPIWGEEIRDRATACISEADFESFFPSTEVNTIRAVEAALQEFEQNAVNTLLVIQPTMSDGRFAPIIARDWGSPIALWATPERQTGEMISSNSLVGTHVFCATLSQMNRTFEFVYGDPDDCVTRDNIKAAVRVCTTVGLVRNSTVGLIGYHAPGFIDMAAHADAMSALLNVQLYHHSNTEFFAFFDSVPDEDTERALEEIRKRPVEFGGVAESDLRIAARYYAALCAWIDLHCIDALSIRCWPDHPMTTGQWPYLALSLLQTDGYPVTQEGDVDGAITAMIAESLGIGPVYLSDWLEHDRDTCAIWHTGVIPLQFCGNKGTVGAPRLAKHFNNHLPVVVEGTVPPNLEVTVFRIWYARSKYHLVAFEGTTDEPKRHLLGTNGLVRAKDIDLERWFPLMLRLGMPHHVSVVYGHKRELLEKIAFHFGFVWHDIV